ncbi:two-component system activity regulator YycH, partial [Paucilactobacillus wasatchensis]|uniref:two-component system activity regulator YycH n=1 Tax=Paucilactobacillus wasatchensis TaxID=1335616 RepID=UPI0005C70006
MIRRIRDNWLPIILTLAILLSLVLSWFIWTNPARYERSRENNTSGQSQLTSKSIADIFLPTQIVKTKQNGTQYLLHAKKNNLVLSIKQKVSKWKFGSEIKVTSDNKQRYQKYLMRKNSISLNYPDQISASVFNQTFGQSISKRRVKQLNRIIIPLHKTKYIYLLNDHTETVYRIHV